MNKKKLLFIIPLCFLVLFNGKKYDEAVKERLFLPIKLCLEGEDCGTVSQASQMSANVSQSEVKKVELSEGSEHVVKTVSYTHLTLPTRTRV